MTTPNEAPKPQQRQAAPDRTPIPISKLLFSGANPHGVNLPAGDQNQTDRVGNNLIAGEIDNGRVKIEIEHRPWMRVFRVTKLKRDSKTVDGKEVVGWLPMGKPFHIPDSWAVSFPLED